jgi:hypothetical protein
VYAEPALFDQLALRCANHLQGKPVLIIGSHRMEGQEVTLPKPVLVLHKVRWLAAINSRLHHVRWCNLMHERVKRGELLSLMGG